MVNRIELWDMVSKKSFYLRIIYMRQEDGVNQKNRPRESVNRYLAEKGIGINDLKSVGNKSLREELIKLLMEKSNLSLRGIAEKLELNREMVRKVQVSRDLSP
ncbi:hypothetical protein PIPA1_10690 [Pelosinus sp. IPA-1]|nr:hypothetical protein PIPA1_10690 [Pelosinus sp. IPA-1]